MSSPTCPAWPRRDSRRSTSACGAASSFTPSTPPAIVKKLDVELRKALADAGVRDKLKAMAVNPGGGPGEEFRKLIEADIKKFGDVVKAANLTFEQ